MTTAYSQIIPDKDLSGSSDSENFGRWPISPVEAMMEANAALSRDAQFFRQLGQPSRASEIEERVLPELRRGAAALEALERNAKALTVIIVSGTGECL